MNLFSIFHCEKKQDYIRADDDDVRFVLAQHTQSYLYSASSLKQISAGRHITPLGHIILIPSRSVFLLASYCYVLSGEAGNANAIVFGFT
jgi:hypothetical protein